MKPGETKNASLKLDKYSVGYYDTDLKEWIAEEGVFEVLIGASSADIRQVTRLHITSHRMLTEATEGKHHSKSNSHLPGWRKDDHGRIWSSR